MIRDLDETLREMLKKRAPPGSMLGQERTQVTFDLPDSQWRSRLQHLTVNCYLYGVWENRELRRSEPIMVRSQDRARAARVDQPVRVDCAYCITAWSPAESEAVLEEHRLLSEVLLVLLRNPEIPSELRKGRMALLVPPYPTVTASAEGPKNQPDFWGALDQRLKPSLNYVVTLAFFPTEIPSEDQMVRVVMEGGVNVKLGHKGVSPSGTCCGDE